MRRLTSLATNLMSAALDLDTRADDQPALLAGEAARRILWWHGAWASAVAVAVATLAFAAPWATWPAELALVAGAAPALVALVIPNWEAAGARFLLIAIWAVAASFALGLTGGILSPLAAWALCPLAVGVLLGRRHAVAVGGALAILILAVAALGGAAGRAAAPPEGPLAYSLGLIGLISVTIGLAAAVMMAGHASAQAPGVSGELVERQPHLIVALSPQGRVLRASGALAPRLAQRLKDRGLVGAADDSARDAVEAALAEALSAGRARCLFTLEEGSVALGVDLLRLPDGRLAGAIREATADQAHEAQLETARADAEALNVGKSRFLANMSHELRTPLNAIMGFADIMRERIFGPLPGKYVEYADMIHDAGSHLLDLINDILDMSKIEAAKYELAIEPLDAREPVQAALRLMRLQADDAGVQLRGVLPSAPMEVDADRRALKQITLNLISNALKFTPRGGLVTVSLQAIAGSLELTVADTGIGIAQGDLERLGRPYEQAGDADQQAKGTGLGLSLVRAFAELHGGEMSIESRLGEGTAVSVRLPVLARDEAAPAPTAQTAGAEVIAFKPQR
jgi:cell cycle sensor histidine kinase DivJ